MAVDYRRIRSRDSCGLVGVLGGAAFTLAVFFLLVELIGRSLGRRDEATMPPPRRALPGARAL